METTMNTHCGTCHYGCECREHKLAVLKKAALDATDELEGFIETFSPEKEETADRLRQIISRVHVACEALGVEIAISAEEAKPCDHVVIVADECAKCGAEV